MLRPMLRDQHKSGTPVRTTCVSGWVLATPSGDRLEAGLSEPRNRSREGEFTPALLFLGQWDMGQNLRPLGQTVRFSTWGGTAGQSMLNILFTTIKCPTNLSHFRDWWDTTGRNQGREGTCLNAIIFQHEVFTSSRSTLPYGRVSARTAKLFPVTLGHGTKSGP
jgi:hypothetical protein